MRVSFMSTIAVVTLTSWYLRACYQRASSLGTSSTSRRQSLAERKSSLYNIKRVLKKGQLEAQEATNMLLIDPTFKLCQAFTAKCFMEQFEFDITKHILGEVYQQQGPEKPGFHLNEYAHLYNQTEEVLEKPEIASSVGEMFRHFPKTELAEVLYGSHQLTSLQTSTGIAP